MSQDPLLDMFPVLILDRAFEYHHYKFNIKMNFPNIAFTCVFNKVLRHLRIQMPEDTVDSL